MKTLNIVFGIIAFVFASCSRGDEVNANGNQNVICDCNFDVNIPPKTYPPLSDSLIKVYVSLWKAELQKKNNMPDAYFNAHIKDTAVSVNVLENGDVVFRMDYLVTIDWAKVRAYDEFAVKLSSGDEAYQYLNLPRDVYYDEKWVRFCIAHDIFSNVSKIHLTEHLAFVSCDEATAALKKKTGYLQICPNYFRLDDAGDATFSGSGTIDYQSNKCVFGSINLANGAASASPVQCYIN